MNLTRCEQAALHDITTHGALSEPTLVHLHGPRRNWVRLEGLGLICCTLTVYGPVWHLTPAGRHHAAAQGQPCAVLDSPSTVADRAYMIDALRLMEARGYVYVDHDVKRGSVPGTWTDHITRIRLRVPDAHMDELEVVWGDAQPYEPRRDTLGHPWLYASISGGGITLARLRQIRREAARSITEGRHGVIVVAPEISPEMERYAESEAAAQARHHDPDRGPPIPPIILIELPRPGKRSARKKRKKRSGR